MTKTRDLTTIVSMRDAIQWAREQQNRPKNPIEFVRVLEGPSSYLSSDIYQIEFVRVIERPSRCVSDSGPGDWWNIDRVLKNQEGYDVMHAWNHNETAGVIYLGHWNDGVV